MKYEQTLLTTCPGCGDSLSGVIQETENVIELDCLRCGEAFTEYRHSKHADILEHYDE